MSMLSLQFYKKYKYKTKSYKEYTDKQIIDAFNLIMSRYSHLNARAIEVDCLVNEINKRFDVSAIPEITENNDRYINYLILYRTTRSLEDSSFNSYQYELLF